MMGGCGGCVMGGCGGVFFFFCVVVMDLAGDGDGEWMW